MHKTGGVGLYVCRITVKLEMAGESTGTTSLLEVVKRAICTPFTAIR